MLTICTLNLNGIRAAARKGFFEWMQQEQTDIFCLQEVRAQESDMDPVMKQPPGYHAWFSIANKKGYAGVALYSRKPADAVYRSFGHAEFDEEGRYLQCDFGNLSVISLYCPSGSASPERQASKFRFMEVFAPHMQQLRRQGKEVIVCGDWNIAHKEIDLKNWKSNQKNSGFLPEERAWMTQLFDEQGWVDVYRKLHPEETENAYTWWSNRGQAWLKNVGWRIDYQIATPGIASSAQKSNIFKEIRFSDHAPLTICYTP